MPLAERYAELLATEGVLRGLIGPRETPRLWERHLINCALLADAFPAEADVCDVGSGAGLPGIVLALRRPDLTITVVEPLLRRTTFLDEVVSDLTLANVSVVRGRAEELHGKREFSFVTSRAVAPLERLIAWSLPLPRAGGALVAMKGSSAAAEIEAAGAALARYGAGAVSVERYGDGLIDPPTTVVRVEATRPSTLGLTSGSSGVGNDRKRPGKSRRKVRGRGQRP